MSIRTMIRMAYGDFTGERLNARTPEVVGGPSWLDTEMYALSAKTEGAQSAEVMMGPMMQSLLEERLQLKVHTEQRETPSYSLVVAKNPSKLIPAKEGNCVSLDLNSLPKQDLSKPPRLCGVAMVQPKDGVRSADVPGATMEEFAGRFLSATAQRPVIDKTGIAGRFDIHLEYSPEMRPGALLNGVPAPNVPEGTGPSIFTALQEQLGLKLVADKALIPVIVVDSAQKPSQE
jgi:uncharacterized protein (TIGR03435 family)